MKLVYTPRAVEDLTEIAAYLVPRSPAGAVRVRAAILATLRIVLDLPHAGRLQTVGDVRKIGVRRYPYAVYYRIDENAGEIVILTIRHSARQRPFHDS